jgi:hypothetical protein
VLAPVAEARPSDRRPETTPDPHPAVAFATSVYACSPRRDLWRVHQHLRLDIVDIDFPRLHHVAEQVSHLAGGTLHERGIQQSVRPLSDILSLQRHIGGGAAH